MPKRYAWPLSLSFISHDHELQFKLHLRGQSGPAFPNSVWEINRQA